jgi:hypothetical protein
MQRIFNDAAYYTSVYVDDDGGHFLLSTCSNIGWFSFGIQMNDPEIAEFKSDPTYANRLSHTICRNWNAYSQRSLPDAFLKMHGLTS